VFVVDSDLEISQSTSHINVHFEKHRKLLGNPLRERGEWIEKTKQIRETAERILDSPEGLYQQTKILDALQLAERVFGTYPNERRVLVIFSDMVEESERYNFRHAQLTPAKIQAVIERERSQQRLANLKGVQVHVVGAAAGAYGHMNSEHIQQMRNFWLAYFKASGADLAPERYGSGILDIPQ